MKNTDKKMLMDRMNECESRLYRLHTYNGIQTTTDYEFAIELYESDGVYALSERINLFGDLPSHEILLAYKLDLPFPADINFLNGIRHDVVSRECYAELGTDDEDLINYLDDDFPYETDFKIFYYFFPELIDPFRINLITDMRSLAKSANDEALGEFIGTCNRMRIKLDELLCKYTKATPPLSYDKLDLSIYNPNPQNLE